MATQRTGTLVTYEDYCNMPEDERYELIDGELIMAAAPSVIHQMIQDNIGLSLNLFIRSNNLGRLFYAATDMYLSDTNVVQPDLLFVSRERANILTYGVINGAPDLVVEIHYHRPPRSAIERRSASYTHASACRNTGRHMPRAAAWRC